MKLVLSGSVGAIHGSRIISLMEMYIKIETYACAVPCIHSSKNIFKVLHVMGCEVGEEATWVCWVESIGRFIVFIPNVKWCMLRIKGWITKRHHPTESQAKESDGWCGWWCLCERAVGRGKERNHSGTMPLNHFSNLDTFTLDTFPILNIRKPVTMTFSTALNRKPHLLL